ncbi:hypothetical protein GF336_04635 [Candidatus Woesearchaeota archaeon]|nr:hypothetical protein [Candidatus Woesearchaeota archaeon]
MAYKNINTVLISLSMVFMAVSAYYSIKVSRIFSYKNSWFSFGGRLKTLWKTLPAFIIFFLLGYIAYMVAYLTGSIVNYMLLTSLIFFSGALFVFAIVYINFRTFRTINREK